MIYPVQEKKIEIIGGGTEWLLSAGYKNRIWQYTFYEVRKNGKIIAVVNLVWTRDDKKPFLCYYTFDFEPNVKLSSYEKHKIRKLVIERLHLRNIKRNRRIVHRVLQDF